MDRANTAALEYLASLYIGMGEATKALPALERAAELQPGEPDLLHQMAVAYLALGRIDESMGKCEEAISVNPDYPHAYNTLAKLHFMTEGYDDALSWADRGLAIAPSRFYQANSLRQKAFYFVWAGRLREAESVLDKTERLLLAEYRFDRFLRDRILWLRGWIALERGDTRKARGYLSTWAAGYVNRFQARIYPEFCLGLLDLEENLIDSVRFRLERMKQIALTGIPPSRAWPRIEWSGAEFWNYYGRALTGAYLLALRQPEKIRPDWVPTKEAMQSQNPWITASWPIRHWLAPDITDIAWVPIPFDIIPRAYLERGMVDSAIAAYEITVRQPPHFQGPIIPRYYYRLARLYEQQGMKNKAVETYTRFLKVWGKADPVYKEPVDARSRLAKLKRVGSSRTRGRATASAEPQLPGFRDSHGIPHQALTSR